MKDYAMCKLDGYSVIFKVVASELLNYDSTNEGDYDKHQLSEVKTRFRLTFHSTPKIISYHE